MKKNNIYLALGGLLTVGVAYTLYTVLKKKPTTFGEAVQDTKETVIKLPTTVKNTFSSVVNADFPLKNGSRGINVSKLQSFLNKEGSYNLVVDGIFGVKTQGAVTNNQEPFETFKSMHPTAVKGQISKEFFDTFIA